MRSGRARVLRSAPALVLAVSVISACSRDPEAVPEPQADYCETVADEQETLGDIASAEDPGSLLEALPPYRELAQDAPRDIEGDWDRVVESLEGLQAVLEETGVDPEEYDAADPPTDLPEEDRTAIERAARELGSEETVAAMARVEQHALDVCGTPLSK